jgi:hypothetical protein
VSVVERAYAAVLPLDGATIIEVDSPDLVHKFDIASADSLYAASPSPVLLHDRSKNARKCMARRLTCQRSTGVPSYNRIIGGLPILT